VERLHVGRGREALRLPLQRHRCLDCPSGASLAGCLVERSGDGLIRLDGGEGQVASVLLGIVDAFGEHRVERAPPPRRGGVIHRRRKEGMFEQDATVTADVGDSFVDCRLECGFVGMCRRRLRES
jgi:hypothetical protein